MFRGRWGILIAVAGLAAGYPVGNNASAQTRPAQNQAGTQQELSPPAANSVENSLARIASTMEAAQADPAADREEQRSESDLQAQRDMAKWAMWMFFAALATTVLTTIGVFLIWRTLLHTRNAAKATERMAFDTAVAVQAAVEANNEMRSANELMKLGRRPWVSLAVDSEATLKVSLSDGRPSHQSITIKAAAKNYGQSPALYPALDVLLFDQRNGVEHAKLEEMLQKSITKTGFGGPPIFPGQEVTLGEKSLYFRPPVCPNTGEKVQGPLTAGQMGVIVGLYYGGPDTADLMSITDIFFIRMPDGLTDDQFAETDKPVELMSLAVATRVT